MSKIRVLPEQIANQIAAGEVVERPASVVKELVENSLDAGSSRIEIEIEGSGTGLIRIIDDGEGMEEDDLLMCLERHGTSKIRNEADLEKIGTLGFRGEAIPSIGSVSKLTISSRTRKNDLGFQVMLQFGKLVKAHETGCRPGTIIEVRNLFGNTPARKKFLRTARTEQGHIEEVVKNYGLACPDITFILRIGGREVLHLDKSLTEERRLAEIIRYEGDFLQLKGIGLNSDGKRKIRGYLIPPEQVQPGPARLRIFVNNRVIRDRMVNHGVTEGMRGFLLKGKNPAGLLHLTIPPEEVDVNVHPAKHEVRFRNSREIHQMICQTVQKAMLDYQGRVQKAIFGSSRPAATVVPMEAAPQAQANTFTEAEDKSFPAVLETHDPVPEVPPQGKDRSPVSTSASSSAFSSQPFHIEKEADPTAQPLLKTAEPIKKTIEAQTVHSDPSQPHAREAVPPDHGLLVIGQYDDLYIFCKSAQGLVVIDQHAAHERLLYEKFRHQYLEGNIAKQNLMFPESIELSIFQSQLVEKNKTELERFGFSLREFGGNTYIISAVPALAGKMSPTQLFIDVLEKFGSERSGSDLGGALDTILATMACKAAVKAGTALSRTEIDTLLNDMARADLFSHCPHGRPVVKQFSGDDVKKWFYRT